MGNFVTFFSLWNHTDETCCILLVLHVLRDINFYDT
jgi:hypothetical protein